MPIYEFECKDCENLFEELIFTAQQSSETVVCPSCGSKNSKKLISAPSSGCTGSSGKGCAPTSFGGFS